MKVKAVDVFVLKFDRHYRLMGREHTPGLLPGTDYYFEPHWPQPYSRKMECCLVKLTADDGMAGWGEAQVPIVPEVAAELIVRLLGPVMLGRDPTDPAARRRELDQMLAPRGLEVGYAADAMSV